MIVLMSDDGGLILGIRPCANDDDRAIYKKLKAKYPLAFRNNYSFKEG